MDSIWMLAVSDLHLGSAFSLWPPNQKLSSGVEPNLNRGQEYMWYQFLKLEQRIYETTDGNGPDIVCEVGDSIHGKNKKQDGEYLIEPDIGFQGQAAITVIRRLKPDGAHFYKFRGSGYHVGSQAETEEWIGYELGAIQDDQFHYCWMWLPCLDVESVLFDVAHHQSAVQVNRSMPLEREVRYAANVDSRIKPMPHGIIRAHGHISGFVEMDGYAAIGLPPMQLQTPFAKTSKVPNRLLTRYLGMALIEILPDRLDTPKLPFELHWLRFLHPPLERREYRRKNNGGRTRLHNGGLIT